MLRNIYSLSKAQFREVAARRMAGFTYTCVVDVPGKVSVWHCARPGTGIYAFTITALFNGMAVTGDIDGLLFRVPSFGPGGYGIPFLTHPDKRYVAEKLEAQCRAMEFDPESFQFTVAECARNKINEIIDDWPGHPLDKSIWGSEAAPAKEPGFEQARDAVEQLHGALEPSMHPALLSRVCCLRSHLDEAAEIDDAGEAHRWLHELERYFGTSDTWECRFERLDAELMQRLYMLEHAALAIQAQQSAAGHGANQVTDEWIEAIVEGMPGGLDGFLKGWGWRQFAREVLRAGRSLHVAQ